MPDRGRDQALKRAGIKPGSQFRRNVRSGTCNRCGWAVLRGMDADRAALEVICDPEPLTATGEALALLSGRRTYALRMVGTEYHLNPRDQFNIGGEAAGGPGPDVLLNHKCHLRLQFPTTGKAARIFDQLVRDSLPLDPPF